MPQLVPLRRDRSGERINHAYDIFKPVFWILGKRFQYDSLDPLWGARVYAARWRKRIVDVLVDNGKGRLGLERRPPRDHLIQNHAEGVNIGLMLDFLP